MARRTGTMLGGRHESAMVINAGSAAMLTRGSMSTIFSTGQKPRGMTMLWTVYSRFAVRATVKCMKSVLARTVMNLSFRDWPLTGSGLTR